MGADQPNQFTNVFFTRYDRRKTGKVAHRPTEVDLS